MADSHPSPDRRGQPALASHAPRGVAWTSGWRAVVVLLAAGAIGAGGYWLYERQRPARIVRSMYGDALETIREGSLEQAAQLLAAAIRHRPDMFEAHLTLGDVQIQLGRLVEAVDSYSRATVLKPTNATAFQRLGEALAACQRFDEAEEALQQAATLAPRDPRPPTTLGHVRMLRQQWSEAAEAFRWALTLGPRDADLHYNLGRAYRAAGQTEQAADAFDQALKCDPSHRPAQRALADLSATPLDGSNGAAPTPETDAETE